MLRWAPWQASCVHCCTWIKLTAAFCIVQHFQLVKQTLEIRPSVFGMRGMFFSGLQEKWPAEPLHPPTPESRLECFTEWWRARMGAVRTWREARQEFSLNKTMCGSWADSPKHFWRRPKTAMAHISIICHRIQHHCNTVALCLLQQCHFPRCWVSLCVFVYICMYVHEGSKVLGHRLISALNFVLNTVVEEPSWRL